MPQKRDLTIKLGKQAKELCDSTRALPLGKRKLKNSRCWNGPSQRAKAAKPTKAKGYASAASKKNMFKLNVMKLFGNFSHFCAPRLRSAGEYIYRAMCLPRAGIKLGKEFAGP
jgi:hypothetical protein